MRQAHAIKRSACMNIICLLCFCFIAACGTENTPESIAEAFIEKVEGAAENRSVTGIQKLVSENYQDERGRTKQDVVSTAAAYLLANRSIHVYSKLTQAALQPDGSLQAEVLAALAARPIEDLATLPSLNADMYWFDILIEEKEGDWLLKSAVWRQALVEDFLGD